MKNFISTGFFNSPIASDSLRTREIFQGQPSQIASKHIVRFSPTQSPDVFIAEAARKIAAGESLLASHLAV